MPPALSDDGSDLDQEQLAIQATLKDDGSEMDEDVESEKEEETPEVNVKPRGGLKGAKKVEEPQPESEDEEGDEEEEGEDEFVVEAITDHVITKGKLSFLVKWEGWDRKSDMTWEPEDSLREGAEEILETYLESQGGRDAIFSQSKEKGKKRSRKSAASETPTPKTAPATKRSRKNATTTVQLQQQQHPADGTPPATANDKWSPPLGSWEDDIDEITTEPDVDGKLIVYLSWKNGRKTRHDTAVVYKKCPQRMLKFYEQHVRIVTQGD